MADSIHNHNHSRRTAGVLLALLMAQPAAGATAPTIDSGFTMGADVVTSDFRSNTLELSGNVRVAQGSMSIEAGTAKASDFRSDTSRWTFEQSVHIRSEEADLQSNLATAAIVNGQIADARVEGSPARFEQLGGTSDRQVRGRAGVIEYDFGAGIVKLTNQVWFSNGKDEFRGDVVIYNVRDERVQINPGGSSNRVRGIIRPNPSKNGAQKSGKSPGAAVIIEPGSEKVDERLATDGGGA